MTVLNFLDIINAKCSMILQREQAQLHRDRESKRRDEKLMALVDDVLAEATRNSTIGGSVLALIQKLVDQAGGDPAKLQQALNLLKSDSDSLEAAVLANTPQEVPPAE